jgi:cell wall-associated NlpC family hydrolase
MTPVDRQRVVSEAWTWLKTPYHSGARIKGVGVDCGQILLGVFEAVGLVPHTDTGYYPPDWHLHRSEEQYIGWLDRFCVRLPRSVPPLHGDIALFRYGRCYSHGAILVEDNLLIHAYVNLGVIASRYTEAPLEGREYMHWTLR